MQKAIIGKKIGMTQIFDEKGVFVPVTVIEAGPDVYKRQYMLHFFGMDISTVALISGVVIAICVALVIFGGIKSISRVCEKLVPDVYKRQLMDAVDEFIPTPDRKADQPFLMPVEDVFTITGLSLIHI